MIDNVSFTGAGSPLPPSGPGRSGAPAAAQAQAGQSPDAPPAEVLHALDAAQRVLADLQARQIDLRYEVDPQTKKVHAQLVGPDGSIIREIPARHALDLLAGEHVVA